VTTLKTERRIALFLDFENLVTNTGISTASFDLQPALDRLLEKGKVVFRRAYCDWSRFREAKAGLHSYGVELIDVPPSTAAGKNGADMRLVIDALELCYAREHIDTYVIASGDSDFCPLAYKLRENGRTVIGLAAGRESTSPLFVKACDEFLYLKARGGGGVGHTSAHAQAGGEEASGGGGGGRGGRKDKERGEKDKEKKGGKGGKEKRGASEEKAEKAERPEKGAIPDFVREAVLNLLARAEGPLNPSAIKETLVRKRPDFDVRDLGYPTFSRLLEALERDGLLKLQKGRQLYVLPSDHAPEPSRSSPALDEEEGGGGGGAHHEDEESIPDPEDDDF
jgi:hypothetical protein